MTTLDHASRAKFLEALAEIIDTTLTTAHFNKRCVSVENPSSQPVIHFADGTTHETDLVLGADGIRSVSAPYFLRSQKAAESLNVRSLVFVANPGALYVRLWSAKSLQRTRCRSAIPSRIVDSSLLTLCETSE